MDAGKGRSIHGAQGNGHARVEAPQAAPHLRGRRAGDVLQLGIRRRGHALPHVAAAREHRGDGAGHRLVGCVLRRPRLLPVGHRAARDGRRRGHHLGGGLVPRRLLRRDRLLHRARVVASGHHERGAGHGDRFPVRRGGRQAHPLRTRRGEPQLRRRHAPLRHDLRGNRAARHAQQPGRGGRGRLRHHPRGLEGRPSRPRA